MFIPRTVSLRQLFFFIFLIMSETVSCQPVNHSLNLPQSGYWKLSSPLLPLLLFLLLLVFLLEPSTPNSLPALSEPGISIRRCDRGGRCVHNVEGVCLLGLHLSEGQSMPTPFLPFKASHSHRQTGRERRREEQEEGGGEE